MSDYLNPHKIYPDDISRCIDTPPGLDPTRQVGANLSEKPAQNSPKCGAGYRQQLDEMGRDDTTTVTRDVCYDHGEITNYGAYRCDKCGAKQPDEYPYCPGCGRRIERRSNK